MWDAIRYDADKYCCEHFLIDAYKHYTGKDISNKLLTSGFFKAPNIKNFDPVSEPRQYTIVMFRNRSGQTHVGLWLDGRVLHLEPHGVVWQPLDYIKRDFDRVIFYELSE